ncbi:MAG: HAMP domain-containing histidine kinase [Micrococcales bacterium]|nr:HAMP domain-containing histidine kinase [Micrococcales bacterium]
MSRPHSQSDPTDPAPEPDPTPPPPQPNPNPTPPPRQGFPLSIRLAAILAILLVAGLTVAGTFSTVLLRSNLMAQVDERLHTALSSLAEPGPSQFTFSTNTPTDYVIMDFAPTGEQLGQWPDNRWLSLPPPNLTLTWEDENVIANLPFTEVAATGRGSWRVLAMRYQDFLESGMLAVGTPLDQVDETLARMRGIIVSTALSVAAVASLLGFALVRRSLRPLRAVEATAGAIAAGDLSQRVPPSKSGTEVGRLTDSLNTMLTQIESSFDAQRAAEDKMRRFVSDASHELRTPLAAIRGYGELYRMGALADAQELASAMRRMEDEATRMGSLVADLLQLTRLDEGRGLRREQVDLAVLATDAAADLRALDPTRPVTLTLPPTDDDGPGLHVPGDEERLRQVMANLAGNAARHTPSGTPVEIEARMEHGSEDSQWAVIEVRDHGPGIPPEEADRVFERFYRLDASRSRRSGGGSGLGLAIVASVVEAHGGRVLLVPTPGGGATFRLDLPLARPE